MKLERVGCGGSAGKFTNPAGTIGAEPPDDESLFLCNLLLLASIMHSYSRAEVRGSANHQVTIDNYLSRISTHILTSRRTCATGSTLFGALISLNTFWITIKPVTLSDKFKLSGQIK